MERQLSGKSAVVTGSTSGIGLGIARALAEAGASVMLNGLGNAAAIERDRAAIEHEHGVRALHSTADMTRPADIRAMIAAAEEAFGKVDILVNNAGIQHVSPVDQFPDEKWDEIIAINLSAAFHAIKAALPGMKSRGAGRIVNIASVHALVASPYKTAYVAAKHGLAGLTKAAALEVAEQGITVNAIGPGYVMTPLVEGQIPDTARARGISEEAVRRDVLLAAQPNRRFIRIEEVAALTVYLCSDSAASITGSLLSIDGGWTAQ